MTLSKKRQLFVNEYLKTFNATQAARAAGYSGNDNVMAQRGYELVRNSEIRDIISKRLQESAMSADEVLQRLAEHARSEHGKNSLSALNTLAKYHGLLTDRIEQQSINLDIDLNDLTDEQLQRLADGEDLASIFVDK
jgi:phage terminase small subunit